ncbi:MAG: hypothetical protein ACJAWC_000628 [Yoonia sp.]|jgi:hypothetical protein
MKRILISALVATLASAVSADTVLEAWDADRTQIFDAADINPSDFVWQVRPLVVFAQSPLDPLFIEQLDLLQSRIEELAERDIIIITDTDPQNPSALRTALRPRAFMLTLIGKDGRTAMRKPAPYDVRELSRTIDKMPMRQQEIIDRRKLNLE